MTFFSPKQDLEDSLENRELEYKKCEKLYSQREEQHLLRVQVSNHRASKCKFDLWTSEGQMELGAIKFSCQESFICKFFNLCPDIEYLKLLWILTLLWIGKFEYRHDFLPRFQDLEEQVDLLRNERHNIQEESLMVFEENEDRMRIINGQESVSAFTDNTVHPPVEIYLSMV